jgi:hypothetical protein
MPDPLFFLGAGASAPFGIPTMMGMVSQFEQKLLDAANTGGGAVQDELQLYQTVKNSLVEMGSRPDLEGVFTVIDSISNDSTIADIGPVGAYIADKDRFGGARRIATDQAQMETAKGLKDKFRTFVRQACWFDEERIDEVDKIYKPVFDAIGQANNWGKETRDGKEYYIASGVSIFTTNYDTIVELYWKGLTRINDLFVDTNDIKTFNPSFIDPANQDPKIVHLHGAINWVKPKDGSIARSSRTESKRIGRSEVIGEVMLYPIQQKDLYLSPWFELFTGLKRNLSTANRIVVIGYSFNDQFIRDLFKHELDTRPRKTVLVDTNAGKIISEKFKGYEKHFLEYSQDFQDADFSRIASDALK